MDPDSEVLDTKNFVGATVTAKFSVKNNLEILQGHFPGNPILPGVIQVEMMAQAAPFVFLSIYTKKDFWPQLDVALLGVDKSRFRKPVVPDMDLTIHSKLTKVRGDFQNYTSKILHGDDLISSAELFASLRFIDPKEL